jgi:hypothetical protein
MTLRTIRRNQLAKRVQRGEMEARCAFSYVDDGYPSTEPDPTWKPARIMESHGDSRDGYYNLFASDFTSNCGRAYLSDPTSNIVTLHVHSNNVVYLRPRNAA